jgi:hypothetical protein
MAVQTEHPSAGPATAGDGGSGPSPVTSGGAAAPGTVEVTPPGGLGLQPKVKQVISAGSLVVVLLVVLLIMLLAARVILTVSRSKLGLHGKRRPRPNRKTQTPPSAWEEAGRRLQVGANPEQDGDEDDYKGTR